MTAEECYETFGGDYEDVMSRLMTEERVVKYLHKFVNGHSLELLKAALAQEDYELAFREAHNLKGVCANLSFTALGETVSVLTDLLRGQEKPEQDLTPYLKMAEECYQLIEDCVNQLS
jgi:HPt (histidine-containing phosphotransfer) domain-containing protein